MPSATYGTPYVNKAPIFFCSVGSKNHCSEALKNSFTAKDQSPPANSSFPYAWPAGKSLRIKVLPNQNVHPGILAIIKKAFDGWTSGMSECIGFSWVNEGEQADIRISFRNDEPNWSALGSKAIFYDEATMNFSFGGWKKMVVFPHNTISRAAQHLFGHALGFQHAFGHWANSPWNSPKLVENYGPFWANMISTTPGHPKITNQQSVMAFDRPGSLATSGLETRSGGDAVDAECLSLLKAMYALPSVQCSDFVASSEKGFKSGIGQIEITRYCQVRDRELSNIITGLNKLDMGLNGNFRIGTSPTAHDNLGYYIRIGCWADTHLIDASCSIMSFKSDDTRIQTGTEDFRECKPGGPLSEDVRARTIVKRINFSRPWKNTPKVVAFIRGFDAGKDRNLRVSVEVSSIHPNGFTLSFGTWGDTLLHNLQVGWLAHEADEFSIRSGNIYADHYYPNWRKEDRRKVEYSSPMRRTPQALFRALTYIDVDVSQNLRFQLDASYNEKSVEARFHTWEESKFFCLRGCYIAVL